MARDLKGDVSYSAAGIVMDLAHREGDIEKLGYIADLLNEGVAPWVPKLRGWLDRWLSAASLEDMLVADPALLRAIGREHVAVYVPSVGRHAFQELREPRNVPVWLFIQITLNPEGWRLGCCRHCEKIFIRQSARASVYCSHRCASKASAMATTQKRRAECDRAKLDSARVAIERWERLSQTRRAKQDWKEYVAAYDPAAELTTKYLTRAVNSGRLKPPEGEHA